MYSLRLGVKSSVYTTIYRYPFKLTFFFFFMIPELSKVLRLW